jgi:hypothetical protein
VARHRLLVIRLAAELAHLSDRRVDVRHVEVDLGVPGLARHQCRAAPVADLGHAVVEVRHHAPAERPPEDAFPEALRAVDVGCGDLVMNDVSSHTV